MNEVRFFLVAGEMSGDTHGAELMVSLTNQCDFGVRFGGLGGPQMAALAHDGDLSDWIADAAVVGLWEVLKKYGYFKERFRETLAAIALYEPDVVVLIDYPGFNLRLAKALKKAGYAGKIAYYISPQVWAWNKRRIPVMAEVLDLMICIFPFEKALYEDSGLKTEFAGHPLVDELQAVPKEERSAGLLGLFPGSREREVSKLFPLMLDAAERLLGQHEGLQVEAAAANDRMAVLMGSMARERGVPVSIAVGQAHGLMQRATVGVVASGTATLEAAWFGMPYCLVYKVAWSTYLIAKALVKIEFLGIVNILARREVVQELIQHEATPEALQQCLGQLLNDRPRRENLSTELREVCGLLGEGGTHDRAASALLGLVRNDD